MANTLYDPFKQGLLDGGVALAFQSGGNVIKISLIDGADYTFSAAHDEYSGGARDVPAAAIVAESAQLGSPTIVSGVFDTADWTWSAVTGDPAEDMILWDDTITNDLPVAFYDTGMTGMPVTPNGGDITGTVNVSGWFAL